MDSAHGGDNVCCLNYWKASCCKCSCGHLSLRFPDGTYISFWPETEFGKCDIKHEQCNSKCIKTFSEEIVKKGNPDCTLEVPDLDITAMNKWWETFSNQAPKYNVWEKNCATVVLHALCEGNPWFKTFGHLKSPSTVFKIVECFVKKKEVPKLCLNLQYYCQSRLVYFLRWIYKRYDLLNRLMKVVSQTVTDLLQNSFSWVCRLFSG